MSDEIIREVRQTRHAISHECDNDVRKVIAYYRAFQDELKRSGRYRFADAAELKKESVRRRCGEQSTPNSSS